MIIFSSRTLQRSLLLVSKFQQHTRRSYNELQHQSNIYLKFQKSNSMTTSAVVNENSNNQNVPIVLEESLKTMEDQYKSGKTSSLSWRTEQLNNMKKMITNHQEDIIEALQKDLNKSRVESILSEINKLTAEINFALHNVEEWMRPTIVASPAIAVPAQSEIRHEPRGVSLIIGPFNYPILLPLLAAVGSLTAGNPTVIKPSELTVECSKLLKVLTQKYFASTDLLVVEGGVDQTTELLQNHWGMIHFTGSARVGKIIATAAGQTLSPTLLELGGKSPTLIHEHCSTDMKAIAKRIIWGKTLNAGQTCVAPDYILCHSSHVQKFCEQASMALKEMFPCNDDPENSNIARMVTKQHAQRQLEMLKEAEKSDKVKIITGGSHKCDVEKKYIAPTIILNPPLDSKLMTDEIFGPILPIIPFSSEEEAVTFIKNMEGTPLALYIFVESKEIYNKILKQCPSGGASQNDVIMHLSNSHLPFGGLGTSGYGNYFGKFSFDAFSHQRASFYRPCADMYDIADIRYHPFSDIKEKGLVLVNKLPDIPNLRLKKKLLIAAALASVYCGLSFVGGAAKVTLASVFRNIAKFLDP